jgi:hypothetical protein
MDTRRSALYIATTNDVDDNRLSHHSIQKPAATISRTIRNCDDLSFNQRDAQGRRLDWLLPVHPNNWHEHYGLGEMWFDEIVTLARHDPEEAYYVMSSVSQDISHYWNHGHSDGFYDRMTRWALAAILTNPAGEPSLPFELPNLGITPTPTQSGFGVDVSNRSANSSE